MTKKVIYFLYFNGCVISRSPKYYNYEMVALIMNELSSCLKSRWPEVLINRFLDSDSEHQHSDTYTKNIFYDRVMGSANPN